MNRQYIGARYVPKIFNNNGSNAWVSGISYESLTVVTYLNNSYTSIKNVPSSVGNPADNSSYWVCTGNYNAQIGGFSERLSEVEMTYDKIFNSVSSMKNDTSITIGMHLKTTGYYSVNDGGWGEYYATDEVPDVYAEELDNGLYAVLINNKHNIMAYGAKNNTKSNTAIENAITNNDDYIYIPEGTFYISDNDIEITKSLSIIGGGNSSILKCNNKIKLDGVAEQHFIVNNIHFKGSTCLLLGSSGVCLGASIENCWFDNVTSGIELDEECDDIRIVNNHFIQCNSAVKTISNASNKTNLYIVDNHFQMQPNSCKSVELFNAYNLNITNNIFQCTDRTNINFIVISDTNNYVIDNNYFEITNSESASINTAIKITSCASGDIKNNSFIGAFGYIIDIHRPTFNTLKIGKIYYVGGSYEAVSIINTDYTSSDIDKVDLDYELIEVLSGTNILNNYNGINSYKSTTAIKDSAYITEVGTPYEIDLSDIATLGINGVIMYATGNTVYEPMFINLGQNASQTVEGEGTIVYTASTNKIVITKGSVNLNINYKIVAIM